MFDVFPTISSIGVVIAVLGLSIFCAAILWNSIQKSAPKESYLAPTLGIDALDSDLRVLYLKTLVFDEQHRDLDGAGRELRRLIFVLQAVREREAADSTTEVGFDFVAQEVESPGEHLTKRAKTLRKSLQNH